MEQFVLALRTGLLYDVIKDFVFILSCLFSFFRCVMKMDHHCPWINNCCGHLNHAYFTTFLLLAPLGCIHAAFIFIMTMYSQLNDRVSESIHSSLHLLGSGS